MSLKEIWDYEEKEDFPGMKVVIDGKKIDYSQAVEELDKSKQDDK